MRPVTNHCTQNMINTMFWQIPLDPTISMSWKQVVGLVDMSRTSIKIDQQQEIIKKQQQLMNDFAFSNNYFKSEFPFSNYNISMNNIFSILILVILFCSVRNDTCPSGQLTFNGTCTPVSYIEGCFTYDSPTTCSVCEFNYKLINSQCDFDEKDKTNCCLQFDSNGECSQCQSGLYISNGACIQSYLIGCLQKQLNMCSNCATGFYLQNGQCLKGIHGCANYSDIGICTTCKPEFILDNGKCNKVKINGCNQTKQGQCIQCYSPFVLTNGSCGIDFCRTFNDFGCIRCDDKYYLKNDSLCYIKADGCELYQKGVCVSCAPLYNLESDTCVMDGCTNFTAGLCVQCKADYQLINGSCKIQNCFYFKHSKCFICENGYHLHSNQCVKPLQNCVDIVREVCHECAQGFHLGIQNHCLKDEPGCSQYKKGLCQQCTAPFLLNSDNVCYLDGCKEWNNQSCISCQPPYKLLKTICVLDFCNRASKGVCLQCQSGYHINQVSCVINDPNCQNYSQLGQCQSCISGYFLSAQYDCKVSQPGCIYKLGVCSDCISPFSFLNGVCNLQGCLNYTGNNCITCATQYYLSNNICLKSTPGCIYFNSICTSCLPLFSFNSALNNCQIDGCSNYSYSGCVSCLDGYSLQQGSCYLPNCITSLNGKCLNCSKGFISRLSKCIPTDPNCLTYNSDGLCTNCNSGYWACVDGFCNQALPGCVYSANGCQSCSGVFTYDQYNRKCYIEGCSTYNNDSCAVCSSPYVISNKVCKIPYCQQSSAGKCLACQDGYRIVNDLCVLNIAGCKSYSTNGNCVECHKSKYLDLYGSCQDRQPGCVYTNGSCQSCLSPFTYSNSTCIIIGCNSSDFTGCIICNAPFTLSVSKACVIPNCQQFNGLGCQICNVGYLVKEDSTCVKQIDNCIKYNSSTECTQCSDGFFLNNGQTNCIPNVPGCVYQNGFCTSCVAPFSYESQNKCVIFGCDSYNKLGCSTCHPPLVLTSQNNCSVPRCTSYCPVQIKCIKCEPGYVISSGMCQRDIPYCATLQTDGTCGKCSDGYYLSNDSLSCLVKLQGCIYTNGICSSCLSPFTMGCNGVCKIQGCLNYSNSGCLACVNTNFVLSNNVCVLPNCLTIKHNTCITCAPNFMIRQGLCFSADPNCLIYGPDNQCSQCAPGFRLGGDYLCKKQIGKPCNKTLSQPLVALNLNDIDLSSDFGSQQGIINSNVDSLVRVSDTAILSYSSISNSCSMTRTAYNGQTLMNWQAATNSSGQFVGYKMLQATNFYQITIQKSSQIDAYLISFSLAYTVDGMTWITLPKKYDACRSKFDTVTIQFDAIFALEIRIIVVEYYQWPAFRFEFYVADDQKQTWSIGTDKISQSILTATDSQRKSQFDTNMKLYNLEIDSACKTKQMCWVASQYCQNKLVKQINFLHNDCPDGTVTEFYIDYLTEGDTQYKCYNNCDHLTVTDDGKYPIDGGLLAKSVRIHPTKWNGKPNMKIRFDL